MNDINECYIKGSDCYGFADWATTEDTESAHQAETFHAFFALWGARGLEAVVEGGDGAPGKELSLFGRVVVVDESGELGSCVLNGDRVESTEEEVLCLHAEESVICLKSRIAGLFGK